MMYMFIPDAFFLHLEHRYLQDPTNIAMKEHLQFVQEGFLHGPCFTAPQEEIHRNGAK
jgi:hypothetical protein